MASYAPGRKQMYFALYQSLAKDENRPGHSLFLQKSVVAVGWTPMGDLSAIPANRDALKAAVAKAYPTAKPGPGEEKVLNRMRELRALGMGFDRIAVTLNAEG